jgi:hypothetical protein
MSSRQQSTAYWNILISKVFHVTRSTSTLLTKVLPELDDGGFKKQLQVLEKAAGEFPNSSVDFCEGLEEWNWYVTHI